MKQRMRSIVAALCVALTLMFVFAPQPAQAASNTWVNRNGSYYYLGSNGLPVRNTWIEFQGNWYYLGVTGRLLTNSWLYFNGAWYYFGADGKPVINGWVRYLGLYFYMDKNGNPVTSDYIKYQGEYYFFGSTGVCILTGSTVENYYNSLSYSQREKFLNNLFDATGVTLPPIIVKLLSYQDLDLDLVMGIVDVLDIDLGSLFLDLMTASLS